jgi:hypothetical protein
MANHHLLLPKQNVRDYANQLALKLACEQLKGLKDVEEQCQRSGGRYLASGKAVIIDYLHRSYRISMPDGAVTLVDTSEAVPVRDQILILHYFTRAGNASPSSEMITYRELPDGMHYYPIFYQRAIAPIIKHFAGAPERLIRAGRALGGYPANYGDAAVTIDAFIRVPVTIVLWRGDSEFSAECIIMFKVDITRFLSNDDIHTLCETISWKLIRSL